MSRVITATTVIALENALRVPSGWLFSHEGPTLTEPGSAGGSTGAQEGIGDLARRIAPARCAEIGLHASRLREELGLSVAEVARECDVSRPTLMQWERGTFPKALTVECLRAWERVLLLTPDHLLTPSAAHPRVRDGRWCVVVETDTLEAAIHRVAECLATRGRNLIRLKQPLDARAARDADLLAHRYGIGAHRWPLIDAAVSYGMTLSHAHQTIASMIARADHFEFDISALHSILEASAVSRSSPSAVSERHMQELLGASISMERAAAFASEILFRQGGSADALTAAAWIGILK